VGEWGEGGGGWGCGGRGGVDGVVEDKGWGEKVVVGG